MSVERLRLPDSDLLAALRSWPVPEPFVIEPIAPQLGSDCWHVHCDDGTRWVAKFAYDSQDAFETGLRVGELLNGPDLRAPVVMPSRTGRLSELVEWPPGGWHPLALMSFVPGTPVTLESDRGPELIGRALGQFHSALTGRGRWVPVTNDGLIPYLENGGWELLEGDAVRNVVHAALLAMRRAEADQEVTRGVIAVDGLEVLADGDRLGVVDFHTVTWGSLVFDLGEAARACESVGADFEVFLAAYRSNSPLHSEEYELVPTYTDLAIAWRLRVASWYALHQDPSGRWREETYRLLDGVREGALRAE